MKVFRLKEYSVSGENSLSRCEAERLSAYLRKKKLQNVVSLTPQGIVSKSFVGVIRCGNVQIEILPKILSANDDRREIMENLVYMLSYTAGWTSGPKAVPGWRRAKTLFLKF